MGERIRSHDWSTSTLGPPETWPQSLQSALSICLHSSFPTAIYWGPELRLFYNDAWAPIPAERHPSALGRPARDVWSDIWAVVGDQFQQVLDTGEGFCTYDQLLPMVRGGVARETYWNYSFTPIRGEDGTVAGIFNQGHETTDRLMTERRSLSELQRLQAMFDQAPGFMAMLRAPDHVFELANPAYLQLIGHRDVLGRPVREALPEVANQGGVAILDKVIQTGEPFVGTEMAVDLQRGSDAPLEKRFVDLVYQPIMDPQGRVTGVFVEGYDVTDRVRAILELRRSEERLRFMAELDESLRLSRDASAAMRTAAGLLALRLGSSRAAYADVDADNNRFIIRDDFAQDGVGSSAGVYSLDLFGSRAAADMRSGRTLVIHDMAGELALGEGREMFLSIGVGAIICCPLVKEGQLVAMMAAHQDAPRPWRDEEVELVEAVAERCWSHVERVGAEARLRELNETLEQRVTEVLAERKVFADLFETTNAFVQILDRDFNVLAVNNAAAAEYLRVYGIMLTAGDNLLDRLADSPEEREVIKGLWTRVFRGDAFGEVMELGDPNHGRCWYDMRFAPVHSAAGEVIGASLFGYDVTARILAEEQLRQSQKLEAMGSITGGVSHDFNNLLTPIIGALDLLHRRGLGGDRERRLVEGALQSAERARLLVQRLLAFARRQPLQPTSVDIGKLIDGMADLIASTTGPQIALVIDLAGDLPPALADQNQVEMALLNLSVNARDAMPDGGTLRISASGQSIDGPHPTGLAAGDYVLLSVADTGCGMDEHTLARAVEPFYSTKGVGKGTGLGLSMVHGLAAQLGGALTIASEIGEGTVIELWLPIGAGTPENGERASIVEYDVRGRGTVLLVDDEALVRATAADMLADLGFTVVEASSAEEALHLLGGRNTIDFVITDHLMPGRSGSDLALEIRGRWPHLPVLLVSGYADAQGVAPELPKLAKPFRRAELAQSVAELIGNTF